MPWLNAVLFGYAAVVLAGGVMGYVSAQSVMSLVMSAAAAALVVIGILLAKSNQTLGYGICGAVALLLAGFFAHRISQTGSMMPGAGVLGLSIFALACLLYAHFTSK